MKLYTRTGDDGGTGLFGKQRVGKDDPRVEAVGDVDELNSAIGLARVTCAQPPQPPPITNESKTISPRAFDRIDVVLREVQNDLFDLGADLATPSDADHPAAAQVRRIDESDAARLESHIDRTCEPLPKMTQFILPGGTELAARLHLARTVCRRAERRCVALSRTAGGVGAIVIYLNRLSDLLFALARRANQIEGVADVTWEKRES